MDVHILRADTTAEQNVGPKDLHEPYSLVRTHHS